MKIMLKTDEIKLYQLQNNKIRAKRVVEVSKYYHVYHIFKKISGVWYRTENVVSWILQPNLKQSKIQWYK